LRQDVPVVRLAALNVLDRMGVSAKAAVPEVRKTHLPGKGHIEDYVNRMIEYLPPKMEQALP
jgi:hypothetical protein